MPLEFHRDLHVWVASGQIALLPKLYSWYGLFTCSNNDNAVVADSASRIHALVEVADRYDQNFGLSLRLTVTSMPHQTAWQDLGTNRAVRAWLKRASTFL